MGNFNRFNRGRDNRHEDRGFGGDQKFSGRSDRPRQMFPAVCGKCHQNCEVPFKPTAAFPVFCNNCFKSQGGDRGKFSTDKPRFGQKNFGGANRSSFQPSGDNNITKAQFESLNFKLDKILTLLDTIKLEATPKAEALGAKISKKVINKEKNPVKKTKKKKK